MKTGRERKERENPKGVARMSLSFYRRCTFLFPNLTVKFLSLSFRIESGESWRSLRTGFFKS